MTLDERIAICEGRLDEVTRQRRQRDRVAVLTGGIVVGVVAFVAFVLVHTFVGLC